MCLCVYMLIYFLSEPPNAPKSVNVETITDNSAIVEFEELQTPEDIGDGPLGVYVVNCTNCQHNEKFPIYTKSSPFNVTGLGSLATYHLKIYNRNNITILTGHYNFLNFNFTTSAGGKYSFIYFLIFLFKLIEVLMLNNDTIYFLALYLLFMFQVYCSSI